MPVPDFAQNIQVSFLDSSVRAQTNAKASAKPNPDNLTFDDFVDIINPIQHFPVVSTLYRKFSGDQIRPLPKIAGDTLYGGPIGLASSLADYAFERVTGKDFGDTVLGLITGDHGNAMQPTAVASKASPAALAQPKPLSPYFAADANTPKIAPWTSPHAGATQPSRANVDALMTSLDQNGVDKDLGIRALNAYRWMYASGDAQEVGANNLH